MPFYKVGVDRTEKNNRGDSRQTSPGRVSRAISPFHFNEFSKRPILVFRERILLRALLCSYRY